MTKIDIFSGFLGAGKTTLIKKLIEEAYKGEKLVLIENEFGEIGIDGGFLKDAGVEINEMNSGCICCSLVGDFGEALKKVMEQFSPDRILIEPSGVGKLSDVIKAVLGLNADNLELNSFTTVVDATKCKMYMKNFKEFYQNQIENASTIILSRTTDIKEEKLNACLDLIKELNKNATVVTTPWEQLSGAQILAAMNKENTLAAELERLSEDTCPVCGHSHHDHEHHHDDECCHHDHEHHHDHECCHHDHEHHHDDECCHHDHEHHHDGECCHHDHEHHHHHADEVFTNWGFETAIKYSIDEINNILDELNNSEKYGIVLRAKGIAPSKDGEWIYYDFVPGEKNVRTGSPDVTGKHCVIGSKLNEAELEKLFKKN